MNTIEFHRYIISGISVKDVVDHVECYSEEVDFTHALNEAEEWLKDHYGHVDFWFNDFLSGVDNKKDLINLIKGEVPNEVIQCLRKL